MSKESYVDFYKNEYRTLYGDNDISKIELVKFRMNQAQMVYDFVSKCLPVYCKVIFDVGCNMGTMLVPFHRAGCDVVGVDYDEAYIEYGKQMTGLRLEVGGVERLKECGKKANLVILNHVLEHFLDLDQELKEIRGVLEPGAFIYISLPGTFWWIANVCGGNLLGLLQNAHTWQFSLQSLTYVMECNGFELVWLICEKCAR